MLDTKNQGHTKGLTKLDKFSPLSSPGSFIRGIDDHQICFWSNRFILSDDKEFRSSLSSWIFFSQGFTLHI